MNRRELEQDLQDLFEGRLDAERFKTLQRVLRSDPETRGIYLDYAELHSNLQFRAEGTDLMQVVSMEKVVERSQRRFFRIAFTGAVAAVLVGMAAMTFILTRPPSPVLTFKVSPGTRFVTSHPGVEKDAPAGRAMQPGSRLEVSSGTVELDFASGVRGIVRGPADLTLQRDDLLDLANGTVWFEVPAKAVGFQVATPDFVLTDLGTEFGIVSEPNFLDEVHVFAGRVEVRHRKGLKTTTQLRKGEARFAGPAGRWREIPIRRDHFLDELPTTVIEPRIQVSEQSNMEQFVYAGDVSDADLLHGLTPVTTGWNIAGAASPLELTDGIHGVGFDQVPGDRVQGAWTTVGATAEYNLGLSPGGAGWNITSIQSIADWNSAGFGNQAWTVEVKPVGGSYRILHTVNCHPLAGDRIDGGGATKVVLTDKSGVLAKGIESIKFTAGHVANSVDNAFVWREVDVFGRPAR
jgi:ferric-dicitrate binding protein FerR (iron transport regulator)